MSRNRIALIAGLVSVCLLAALSYWPATADRPQASAETPRSTEPPVQQSVATVVESPTPASVVRLSILSRVNRTPLFGAMVKATVAGVTAEEAKTDESGQVELRCASQEGARFEVTARGFHSANEPARCGTDSEILLSPGVLLEGVVVTAAGAPAIGASVECLEGIDMRAHFSTVADARGRFSFVCEDGDLRVRARHSSGVSARLPIGIRGGGSEVTGIELQILASRNVSGRVFDADSKRAVAKILLVRDGDDGRDAGDPVLIATDAEGSFDARVELGPHRIVAVASDGRAALVALPRGIEDVDGIELHLPLGTKLHGRLDGDATDARVIAFPDQKAKAAPLDEAAAMRRRYSLLLSGGSPRHEAVVDGHQFTFTGLDPGTYSLWATSRFADGRVMVSTTASGEVVIPMKATGTLTVRLEAAEGEVLSGGFETLAKMRGGWSKHRGFRGNEFTVDGLLPGEYELRLKPKNRPVPPPRTVEIVAGPNEILWRLDHRFERITGRVVDEGSGAPVAGAQLTTPGRSWFGWNREAGNYVVSTDETGAFTIEVASLDSAIFVWHEKYQSKVVKGRDAATISIAPGAPDDQVRLPKDEFEKVLRELREKGELYEPKRESAR